jgi:riboflavin kinase/FMN adenylyltransferase
MHTIHSLDEMSSINQPLHLALGVFDGVHVGHQAVIKDAVDTAVQEGGVAGVLTFEPHPIRVLAPQKAPRRILASIQHKEDLLAALGVEVLIVIPFTESFAQQEARDFLEQMVVSTPQLKTLAMGEDWKFGHQRGGDVQLLQQFGEKFGVTVKSAQSVMLAGERVSSTRIRQAIRDGNMDAVAAMLGREYTVLGTVIHGRQLGRTIGFPTANLRVYNEQLPPDGVWAVEVTLSNGETYPGAGNLGMRPTVEGEGGDRLLEVHLLDYEGDLYGRNVEVRFLEYVRGEKKFASLDELQAQIQKDVILCRNQGMK